MPHPYAAHLAQLEALLLSWGMAAPHAARTAEVMAWADLHGIDSHGISMVPTYHAHHRAGRVRMAAQPRIERETPVSVLLDADGGLGHEPSRQAMEAAIAKARDMGIGVASVHNSAHFGACGFYALMAAEAGMVGMVATSASLVQVAPSGGAQARLGTDPWAFAAPGRPGEPFLLDMATTTVAAGRIRNKANEGLPAPPGWLLTRDGQPSTDPLEVSKGGTLTPLGGSPEGSSHKGYGLAMMVNILGSCLSGAALVTSRQPAGTPAPSSASPSSASLDIGHFFLALSPALFRGPGAFEADMAALCDAMRATPPADPAHPVMVAGDPERRHAAQRLKDGIPVGANLLASVRRVAEESGAPWLLGDPPAR